MQHNQDQNISDSISNEDINKIASLLQIFINIDRRINGKNWNLGKSFEKNDEEN